VTAKPKPRVVKKKPVVHAKKRPPAKPKPAPKKAAPPKLVAKQPQSGVLGAAATTSKDSHRLLIEAMLCLAIGFFAVGAIPSASLRWRPLASLVAQRHLEMTVLGTAFLLSAIVIVIGRGF
jgi:hypothetical protein